MAIAIYHGRHPEPSFTVPIPKPGQTMSFSMGWGYLVANDHIESVSLPPGLPRPIHRWAAIVMAALRQRTGPWIEIHLHRGEWQQCVREIGRPFKVREVLRIFEGLPEIVKNFRECELRPYSWANALGEHWSYDPVNGVRRLPNL